MKNILIIAGGSCAGKSTLISQVLIPLLTTKGIEYSFIPEVATTLLLKGKEYKSTYDFQHEILDCQLYEESQIFKELKGMQLIVLERSALDGLALLSKEEGNQLLNAFMINSRQELASRYKDAFVIYLRSYTSNPNTNVKCGNPVRLESSLEELTRIDESLLQTYRGLIPLENLHVLNSTYNFIDKKEAFRKVILEFLVKNDLH